MKRILSVLMVAMSVGMVYGTSIQYQADAHHGRLQAPVVLKPINVQPYKIIEDNEVIIIRNGERYDVTGKKRK